MPKLKLYCKLKDTMTLEKYCSIHLTLGQRSLLAKLRLGVLPIEVELGRYNGTQRELRTCKVCKKGQVEDEIHFLLTCEKYQKGRESLFSIAIETVENFIDLNDEEKIRVLTTHATLIRKTCKFIQDSLVERNGLIRVA